MYGWRDFVMEGGLMSYGPNVRVLVRQAASYVDRIIKGETLAICRCSKLSDLSSSPISRLRGCLTLPSCQCSSPALMRSLSDSAERPTHLSHCRYWRVGRWRQTRSAVHRTCEPEGSALGAPGTQTRGAAIVTEPEVPQGPRISLFDPKRPHAGGVGRAGAPLCQGVSRGSQRRTSAA